MVIALNLPEFTNKSIYKGIAGSKSLNYTINFWNENMSSLTGIRKKDFEIVFDNVAREIDMQIFCKQDNPIKNIMLNKLFS